MIKFGLTKKIHRYALLALFAAFFSCNGGPVEVHQTALSLTPGSMSPLKTLINLPARLRAIATYSDGSQVDVSLSATWASENNDLVTVDKTGIIKGLAITESNGVDVSATFNGFVAKRVVQVSDATIVGVTMSPMAVAVQLGQTQQFTLLAQLSDNTTLDLTDNPETHWAMDDTTIAFIDLQDSPMTKQKTGLLHAKKVGTTILHVAFKDVSQANKMYDMRTEISVVR